MNFNFAAILLALGADAAFKIANAARAAGDYLFNSFLPEEFLPTYEVKSGHLTIRPTMAGLTAMDSPYPPSGIMDASTFLEQSAKVANHVPLSEASLRQIQHLLQTMQNRTDAVTTEFLSREALNFLQKVVIQSHIDTAEYLRGEALVYGAIDWTVGAVNLSVNYGLPNANLLTARSGNDAYHGSASKFWTDVALAQRLLRYNVRAFVLHPDTINSIITNTVNAVQVTAQEGSRFSIRRFITINGQNVLSSDARESVTLIGYDKEGEILDPANPGKTILVPFMPRGKMLVVGNNTDNGYRVGQGATVDPLASQRLGYTHIAPTTEGGGRPGRWAQLYTPEALPMQLHGRAVTNLLPVIEAPSKIVVATTDMP